MPETPSDSLRTFQVHLYPVAIVSTEIQTNTERDAIRFACAKLHADLQRRLRSAGIDFDGEYAGFLVDAADDQEFTQSRYFYNSENPLLDLLGRFVEWHEAEQPDPEQLNKLLDEAEDVFRHSL